MEWQGSRQVSAVQGLPSVARADFTTVFQEHFNYVWNSLRHCGVHPNDLEDLAHEVFLRVHERYDECDRSRPIRPWLFAFAYRVAATHRRRAYRRLEVSDPSFDPPEDAPGAEERLIRLEERDLALKALESIDIDRRAVFVLHEIDGVPIPEVARALKILTSTAYSRLRLARQEFRAAAQRLQRARGPR
jgi:RNA polymerase sigma-70 factor (ECF subfamily)